MNYPLQLSFKILAIAQQVSVSDAGGNIICFAKQKAFKLKEAVTVFADAGQTQPLYSINADRMLDFSAHYRFTDKAGTPLGSIRRQGMKSFWKANYEITDGATVAMTLKEDNPWVKLVDGFLGEIPILGMFTGYFLHPAYTISRPNGPPLLHIEKRAAFFEGKFIIQKQADLTPEEETRALLGIIMMVLLERSRG
jgi:uncharacterized protein YxjI